MQATLDWITHKPKTNAYFCAIHASVKVVKMNKTIWKNICLLEKNPQAFKSKYICHKESQIFHSFPISWGRQLDFQLRIPFQFLKYYCFLILVLWFWPYTRMGSKTDKARWGLDILKNWIQNMCKIWKLDRKDAWCKELAWHYTLERERKRFIPLLLSVFMWAKWRNNNKNQGKSVWGLFW